jgi:hypothetical protein
MGLMDSTDYYNMQLKIISNNVQVQIFKLKMQSGLKHQGSTAEKSLVQKLNQGV